MTSWPEPKPAASMPLGFSGGFALSLLSGRQSFEELQFDFAGAPVTPDLTVK